MRPKDEQPVALDPAVDDQPENVDHPNELTGEDVEAGRAVYLAVDDLDDESNGLDHPPHHAFVRIAPPSERNPEGLITLAFPVEPTGLAGWKVRRACHRRGGHWWHPADAMIEWACCACGARRDGLPKDGSR